MNEHHKGLRVARGAAAAMLAVAAIGGVAACGGESDEDKIRSLVTGVFDAAKDKDGKKFCDSFTEEAQRQLSGQTGDGCAKALETNPEFLDLIAEQGEPEITEVKVDGDKGTVKAKSEQTGEDTTQVVKEDGDWKLSSAAG